MNNELSIIKSENVELIISNAPTAFNENQISHDRCLNAGTALLETIKTQGMNDELDQQAALYLERARKTVKKMFDKRSPVTKLFDEIRTKFTGMESEVDASKKDTVPFQLQKLRNEYAAKKRAEEQQRQQAFILQQKRQAALAKYRTDVESDYRRTFNGVLNSTLNNLISTYQSVTLDNFSAAEAKINSISEVFDDSVLAHSNVLLPADVNIDELTNARQHVFDNLLPILTHQYKENIAKAKLEYKALLPSKKAELERAAQASAEEAERIKREMAEREAAEAKRIAEEQRQLQEKEQQAAQMKAATEEMNSLFDTASASVQTYQPKTSVKKKLILLNPEGIMPVLSLWWSEEGHNLSVDEITKMFKKQITFCEKLANAKDGTSQLIEDESIIYEDDVKAK